MPQGTNNQQFVNPAFAEIFDGITARMPRITFYGIIVTYLITAGMNVYTIPLPFWVSIPTALAIQYGRFAVVFKNFLNPLGVRSRVPEAIATVATLVSITELAYSLLDMDMHGPKFWSVFLFGMMVIAFGYILEVGFIDEGAKAFGMVHQAKSAGALGMLSQQNNQQHAVQITNPPLPSTQDLIDQNKFLQNQIDQLNQKAAATGNGQAPTRTNRATANLGHLNGSLNSPGHP